MKRTELQPLPYTIYKHSTWNMDVNMEAKIIKVLRKK